MASLREIEIRLATLETKEEERWTETIIRIKRIESLMIGVTASVIGMLVAIVLKL